MSEPTTTEIPVAITGPDPSVSGTLVDAKAFLATLPPRPGGASRVSIFHRVTWQDEVEERVGPGGRVEMSFEVPGPAGLMVRASWFGSDSPPRMIATIDGSTVAEGEATRSPPDAGALTIQTRLAAGGTLRVNAEHTGGGTVTIRLLAGIAVF